MYKFSTRTYKSSFLKLYGPLNRISQISVSQKLIIFGQIKKQSVNVSIAFKLTYLVCTTVSHAKFCLSLLAFRPCRKISFRHWINPPSPSRRPFNSFTGEFSILIKIWILLTEIWRFCWRSSRDLSRWRIDDWLFLCVDKRVKVVD